jgi:hypothetical protein
MVATTVEPSLPTLAGPDPLVVSRDRSGDEQATPTTHMAMGIQEYVFVSSDINLAPFKSLQPKMIQPS